MGDNRIIKHCAEGRDAQKILSPRTGMWKDAIASMDPNETFNFIDDFVTFDNQTGGMWAGVTEDAGKSGTDAVQDAAYGWVKTYCDGDDNDESYYYSAGESWLVADGKDIWFEARVALTEAATDDANWIIGLVENPGADLLQDDGGGPAANYDGIVFFKVDGTMYIQCETSLATAQVTNATAKAFVSGTPYRLGFHVRSKDSTYALVDFYIDGSLVGTHQIAYSGLGEMNLVWGVKAGGAHEEALEIDYIKIHQKR